MLVRAGSRRIYTLWLGELLIDTKHEGSGVFHSMLRR
jgi:hypothetical protein